MKCLSLSVILLLFSFQAFAQNSWKGNVSMNYGSDFDYLGAEGEGHKWYSSKSGAKASFGYTGKAFYIETGGDVDYKSHLSNVVGFTLQYTSGKDTTADLSMIVKDVRVVNGGGYLKTGWTLSSSDKLTLDYTCRFMHDLLVNSSLNFKGVSVSGINAADAGTEDVNNTKGDHNATLTYSHQFLKPGRTITAKYDFSFSNESKYSDWHTMKVEEKEGGGEDDDGITEKQYRITPQMYDCGNVLKVIYSENRLGDVENLDAEFSLGSQLTTDKDYQRAATLVGTQWRDSTSYHENFVFNALTVSPTVHMKYKTGCYGVDASYTPEFYTRRLSSDIYSGVFDYGFISHLVNIKNVLDFKSRHKLSLVYDRSVRRPDYIQICWFERAGPQYSDVSYTGNPDLLPEAKHQLNFSYVFTCGRFSITPDVGYEYKFRIIEQTYIEKKEDKDTRRVYSWINGGHSHINSGSLTLAWKGKSLQGSLGGKINYFHGVANTGNLTLSFDYSVAGEVSYKLKTWEFLCRGLYESKIIRSYSSKDERIKLDLKVGKKLGKFNVFVEALDLFDKPILVTTMNADQTEERVEQIDNKNKLFQIGASFTF